MKKKPQQPPPSPRALANFKAGRYTPALMALRTMWERAGIKHNLATLPHEKKV